MSETPKPRTHQKSLSLQMMAGGMHSGIAAPAWSGFPEVNIREPGADAIKREAADMTSFIPALKAVGRPITLEELEKETLQKQDGWYFHDTLTGAFYRIDEEPSGPDYPRLGIGAVSAVVHKQSMMHNESLGKMNRKARREMERAKRRRQAW